MAELRIVDKKTGITLTRIQYSLWFKTLYKEWDEVKKGKLICEWDPFNAVIISEVTGKVRF